MDEPGMPTTGALVWHLAMRWRSAVDRAVAPLGLTHAQYVALASIRGLAARGEKPSQRRLATWTGLGPIYVSKLVRALERDGLVERAPDPGDARAVQITLTERGKDTADRAIPIVRALDRELTATLGGPGSARLGALGDALRTLLRTAPPTGGDP
ncbi:MAG TPA: MarR family winged helix-turn-helix transcriptional regulator [Acidimicrobiales bacterium]|nr:MarR family winged helix-turn-helix transcriptional regulator [Acidimicrobiales bacterium]